MSTIVTRAAKGSPLTHAEVDANFTNLNTDKYQSGDVATFSSVAIDASTTDATLSNDTSITGWVYSGVSFSVSSQETTPTGLFFRNNGTKFYIAGDTGNDITEFTLGTAWNVSTASTPVTFSVSAQDTAPNDVFFSPDGLTMFVLGGATDTVYQYTLGTAWDISTASYASKSFSVTSQEATPTGMWFKSDGTTMYIVGITNDIVYQYTLSTPWDVSTASYASISFSVAGQETGPSQVNLSADGTKMWITGTTGDDINEYNLGTAWNVSTATFVNNVYVGFQEINPSGLFIDSTAPNRVYIVGTTSDSVHQYNTVTNTLDATTDRFYISGETYSNGNFYTSGNAVVNGGITAATSTFGTTSVSATLSATSTLTLSGSTTGAASFATSQTTANTSICTAQTTGTLTIGGTTQTGTITVGQSTGAQTLNLGTGATTNGTTKTINIGANGVSGSTTNVNIGSAVSGATSNTTVNGFLVNSISAAVTAAGANQANATALVSNINNVTVVATNADGVRLPTAIAGIRILIRNSDAADTLKIYPATGGQIDALGTNASYSLAAGSTIELFASTTTQWHTF
jgi:hypothetical protein